MEVFVTLTNRLMARGVTDPSRFAQIKTIVEKLNFFIFFVYHVSPNVRAHSTFSGCPGAFKFLTECPSAFNFSHWVSGRIDNFLFTGLTVDRL